MSKRESPSLQDMNICDPQQHKCTAMSPNRGNLWTLLERKSPFASETGALPMGEFDIKTSASSLENATVLVVGAGGLGCELMKDLALSGIGNIHVIDLDTIDVTNLNRQFLFRQKDVGKPKADVAAQFIRNRCPWVKVTAHHCKIQDKTVSFYRQFDCVIAGLDNIEARRWLNAMIVSLVDLDEDGDPDPDTIIPIVDGGTEGFSGQARVILPRITSCYECSLDSFPPQRLFPMCTIAETPRLPEHCIAYAFMMEWPKHFPDKKLEKDSPNDMQWVFSKAQERAKKYGISGVTYMLTMGVVKNIIPAVASTNAIIAASCVNETVKLLSFCSQTLNTYMMFMGSAGVYSHTFVFEQKEDCPVCASKVRKISISSKMSLNELIQMLCDSDLRLKKPSITSSGSNKTLYMQNPPTLEKALRPNLDKPLLSLIGENGDELIVTDPIFPGEMALTLKIEFE